MMTARSRTLVVHVLGAAALTLLAQAAPAGAQTVRGIVIDAERSSPIAEATVEVLDASGRVVSALSDASGRFSVRVPSSGTYRLHATALGYRASDTTSVEIEQSWQQVEVVVRLAGSPLELEGISVVARGLDLRHRATLAGFQERHEDALRVGTSRLVAASDGIMRSSHNVEDVLRWFPDPLGCTVVYIDGRLAPGWAEEVELLWTGDLAGVEYYKDGSDAPLELRGGGPPCLAAMRWSVLALWRTQERGGG